MSSEIIIFFLFQGEYRREIDELIESKKRADEQSIAGLWDEIRVFWTKLKISNNECNRCLFCTLFSTVKWQGTMASFFTVLAIILPIRVGCRF